MSSHDEDLHDSDFARGLLGQSEDDGHRDVVARARRPDHHRHRPAKRRRTRVIPVLSLLLVVVLGAGGYVLVRKVADGFSAKDYKGPGTGSVVIQIKTGDGSGDIGATLASKGVVASKGAFLDAAKASGRSDEFQPGFFRMRRQMSASRAVALLLDPTARVSTKVTAAEGLIVPETLALLSKKLAIPLPDLRSAASDIANLGLPDGFATRSAEGFLFPQTYEFDPGVTASQAVQTLTAQFGAEIRKLDFSAGAAKLKMSPYQALIVASMVEAEVKFDADRAKVARVVYNRLAKKIALGFDTTTAYQYKIEGKDPATATYKENSPYNTRLKPGLPPTPIGNPGAESMVAAVEPATGNWLYFVSADAAGHLFFTDNYQAFLAASATCLKNHWGCT